MAKAAAQWKLGRSAGDARFARNVLTPNPHKYRDELFDAYLFVEDADALYAEYAGQGVEFTRGLADMPWHSREFVVKDCDGRPVYAHSSNDLNRNARAWPLYGSATLRPDISCRRFPTRFGTSPRV